MAILLAQQSPCSNATCVTTLGVGTCSSATYVDSIDSDGSLAANSVKRIPTQSAVKTYVDASAAAGVSADSIDSDGTLAANSATRIPTQSAVKTYVDASGGGGGDTAIAFADVTMNPAILDTTSYGYFPQYAKMGDGLGTVVLRGYVRYTGTVDNGAHVLFTLPSGFRPITNTYLSVLCFSNSVPIYRTTRMHISPDGEVAVVHMLNQGCTQGIFYLSGLFFFTT